LDDDTIRERIEDPIIRGPIKQSDLISDVMRYEPDHILIISGYFHQHLSVWPKEILFALRLPFVEGVYGAASMGALRAADLAHFGMQGVGKVFEWYNEGVISDESEVACVYGGPSGNEALTVPLVNVRGAILKALEKEAIDEEEADRAFENAQRIHWSVRTFESIEEPWLKLYLGSFDQKKIDALTLLYTYKDLPKLEPGPPVETLGLLFNAQFERERSVTTGHRDIRLQDIEAQAVLHDQGYEQMIAGADCRELALMLSDLYRVTCSQEDLDKEWVRFNMRKGIRSKEAHEEWLEQNHMSPQEFLLLLSEEVRLRKLRRALLVVSGQRRRTSRLLNYLRVNGSYDYWANATSLQQARLDRNGGEEALQFDNRNVSQLLYEHAAASNQTISLTPEEYTTEMGFGSSRELLVALVRDRMGRN
jgi:hypothetical protein